MMSLPVWLPGPMFCLWVSLCLVPCSFPGGLCQKGVSVRGVSVRGVSVKGVSVKESHYEGDLCERQLL